MSHLTVPEAFADTPLRYVAQNMVPELTEPMYDLSRAVYKHCILSLREFEAARARIAQINGCMICQKFRAAVDVPTYLAGYGDDPSTSVHTHGPKPDEQLYLNVANWRTADGYSEREKVAIEFSERFCLEPDALGYDEAFWKRAKSVFSELELYHLTIAVATFVATGRFVHVLGLDQTSCDLNANLPAKKVAGIRR